MNPSPEHEMNPEAEPMPSILLRFFRHDEKEKATGGGARAGDEVVRLTLKGREHATEAGKTRDPHPEVGVAYGSPRERSSEAALRQLLANEEIAPEDTLEDIREKVGKHIKVGKKDIVSGNLNFNWNGSEEFNRTAYARVLGPRDSLVFLREESDDLVKKVGDMESTSYSRAAGNVAELVQKYLDILPQWERIAAEKPELYAQFKNEMQRFLGSHQDVLEPFLMKVIEKMDGPEGLEKFFKSLPDKNGLSYSQGFSVNISSDNNGDPTIKLTYDGNEWALKPELIEELIKERDALNQDVAEKKRKETI
jgi:hypothetical protein